MWTNPVSNSEAYRRVGGRRRINKERQIRAIERQVAALNLWWYQHLSTAEIAKILGVHRTTVWRYLKISFGFVPGKKFYRPIKRYYTLSYVAGRGWRAYGYERQYRRPADPWDDEED